MTQELSNSKISKTKKERGKQKKHINVGRHQTVLKKKKKYYKPDNKKLDNRDLKVFLKEIQRQLFQ